MRQYDRTGLVGEGVRGGEQIVEIGVGGQVSLEGFSPLDSRIK
jgi:hypothetical protein